VAAVRLLEAAAAGGLGLVNERPRKGDTVMAVNPRMGGVVRKGVVTKVRWRRVHVDFGPFRYGVQRVRPNLIIEVLCQEEAR
jgi:hypothetical protein